MIFCRLDIAPNRLMPAALALLREVAIPAIDFSETGQTTCGSGGAHPNSTTILKNLTLEVRMNLRY